MRRHIAVPKELRGRLFRGRDAVSAGLLTEKQLRSPSLQRIVRGVYAEASMSMTHGTRCEAAAMILPDRVALTGHSAAWIFGVRLADTSDSVTVACPPDVHIKGVQGVSTHRTRVQESDLVHHRGLLLTSPVRLAWDLATMTETSRAVTFLDALTHAGVLSLIDLEKRIAESSGFWRVTRVREAVRHVDSRSESPQETRLRLLVVRAGLPGPHVQFEVRDDGKFVARVDLAWPDMRVAVEYDGAHHADLMQMKRDRRRLNGLVHAGWTVIHATALDLRDPDILLAQIRAALTRTAA